jgi:hypothetical protein
MAKKMGTSAEKPDIIEPTSIMDVTSKFTTEILKHFSGKWSPLNIMSDAGKITSLK